MNDSTSSTTQRLLKNAAWLLGSSGVTSGFQFIQGILAARFLGVVDFGLYALVVSSTQGIGNLLESRTWMAGITYISRFVGESDFGKAAAMIRLMLKVDAATGLIGFLLIQALADLLATHVLKTPDAAGLLRLFSFSLLFGIPVGTSTAVLKCADQFPTISTLTAIQSGVRLAGSAAVLYTGFGLEALLWVHIGSILLNAGLLSRGALKASLQLLDGHVVSTPSHLRGYRRDIFMFLVHTNIQATVKLAGTNGPLLLIGYVLGPASAGIYQVAARFGSVMLNLAAPITSASLPVFANLWHKGEHVILLRTFYRFFFGGFALGVPVAGLMWIFAPALIHYTAGEQFEASVPLLRIFGIGSAFLLAASTVHSALQAMGRTRDYLLNTFLAVSAQLLIILVFLESEGVISGAYGQLAFAVIIALFGYFLLVGTLHSSDTASNKVEVVKTTIS